MKGHFFVASIFIISACTPVKNIPASNAQEGAVTPRDFFVYGCLREYMQQHSIPLFDGSLAYAVEHVEADAELLDRLYGAAKMVALKIPAPNYSDPEHGSPAVLASCERESRSSAVEAILSTAHQSRP